MSENPEAILTANTDTIVAFGRWRCVVLLKYSLRLRFVGCDGIHSFVAQGREAAAWGYGDLGKGVGRGVGGGEGDRGEGGGRGGGGGWGGGRGGMGLKYHRLSGLVLFGWVV